MNQQVIRRPDAVRDLENLFVYIGRKSLEAAERFLVAADGTFQFLAEFPGTGIPCEFENPVMHGLRVQLIRGFANFLVFYFPRSTGIEIIRILHGSQDATRVFERR